MPPAEVLAHSPHPSRSNSTFLRPTQQQQQLQQPSSSSAHRKRSITMTTASAVSQHSKLAAALTAPEGGGNRSRRNSTATVSSTTTTTSTSTSTRKRFSNMMLRRPSQSTSASSTSSGSSSDRKSTSSNMSRRQSLTRATASSLAKVVPSFHNKTTNAESPKSSSQHNGTINNILARRRNSMMTLSNATQPATPKPSGSTVAKSTSYSKLGTNNTSANDASAKNSSNWFGLRRPSSPAIPSPSSSSAQPSPRLRRNSIIPPSSSTSAITRAKSHHPNHMPRQQQHQHDKHDSRLATLAKQQQQQQQQQQQRTNTAHQETEAPDRSISNSSTLKPKTNVPARPAGTTATVKSAVPVAPAAATAATAPPAPPADKAATAIVGAPSVAACAEHSAAQQDSYFEQHHPAETPRTITTASTVIKAPSETCSRLSSRMLDSDISIGSIESRRSSVSSLRTVQSACHHNNTTKTTQHPAWLASAGFMRRTKCTACNPNSHTDHRRSLSRSSSMYDVAQPQASTLRRLSRTSLTEDNGSVKTTNINRRIASADGLIDPPLTPIPNTTVAFIRQQQQQQQLYGNNRSTMPTAAATCAAAMAAAAAVVSAAAATAATTNPDSTNEKWMRLIGNCITHSNKLERLAHDLITSEQHVTHMLETHESMEDAQKSRDQQYQVQVKECETLVRVQREMLVEMEGLLSEHGFNRKEIDTTPQQIQHDLTTPPPSSPSTSSSSSVPSSLADRDPKQEQQQTTTSSSSSSSSSSSEVEDDEEDSQQEEHSPAQEQCVERSENDQTQEPEPSEDELQQQAHQQEQKHHSRQLTESPEPYQKEPEQQQQEQQQEEEEEKEDEIDKPWSEIVEDTVSQIRWNVSQWVGGGVGTGQIVKCEVGPDGLMSTIIVAGTGVTTEPRLLPKHLMQKQQQQQQQHRPDISVYYHQYILYIEREDRKRHFTLMPSAQWVQDDQVKCCQFSYTDDSSSSSSPSTHIQCKSGFDWLARRHHCRSSNRLPLFDAQNAKAEWSRVCDGCFYALAGSSLFHPSEDR
ncbi:hypothetical protein BDB00DRAFT_868852 [Zychaea mexicana]|uniref:uncharacterized protein n=1 Tax=Zychaea mexicana TaxID=64656 RepID=UPI0022FDB0C2|nr:uncharacterized protein BDB00DRAFT_868852 [Zychaea mexicana]KAI9497018.1 hypothetical protein BDB00DRAFT_868852 [Zychaea mexicana]